MPKIARAQKMSSKHHTERAKSVKRLLIRFVKNLSRLNSKCQPLVNTDIGGHIAVIQKHN